MLFAVTTIRLNIQTFAFEHTETNGLLLLGDLEKELIAIGDEFKQFENCLEMPIGKSIEVHNSKHFEEPNRRCIGRRVTYIHRIS